MGNPNPQRVAYRCKTCGTEIPPYDFYCERHQANEACDDPSLLDRFMKKFLGKQY